MDLARPLAALAPLLLIAPLAEGAESPKPAPLSLRAEPARMFLGRDTAASILVEASKDDVPTVRANVGNVSAVRALGGGRFVAEYQPPKAGHPQVAIVSATARDRFAWISIPLHGRGVAVAHTTARGAQIRVTIGDASFGPVRADDSGEARVPVVVPPGVTVAYHREKALDLAIPPVLHVHAVADRPSVRADREELVTLRLAAVSPDGAPRAAAPIALEVTHGAVSPVTEKAPGTYTAQWRLPPGPALEARAIARLEDEREPASVVAISREPGPAARVEINADPPVAEPGRSIPVALRVRVTDAAGNAVGAPPSLTASLGRPAAPRSRALGVYESSLAVPERTEGRRRIDVAARAGEAEGTTAIELAPAAVQRLVIDTAAQPLAADGSEEALVRVTAFDRFGNAVPIEVTASVAQGRGALRSLPMADGATLLRYRPRRVQEDATHVLAIRAGPMAGEARIPIVAPARTLEIAPKVGFAVSRGGLRSPVVAGEAAYWPERGAGRLGVALEAGTFVFDRTDSVAAGVSTVEVVGTARYVPLLLSAAWRAASPARARWWASAGGGAAFVSSRVRAGGQPELRESAWAAAAHLTAGMAVRLGPGAPFAEARLAWHSEPHLDAFRGALTSFTWSVGYRYVAY